MPRPKVLSTHPLFPAARAILDARCDMDYWKNPERIPRAELLARAAGRDAMVCLLTEKVDDELLAAASQCGGGTSRLNLWHGAHGGALPPLWWSPWACISRRPKTDWPTLLHEWSGNDI